MKNYRNAPNLFILGAPKCGTSAMSSYLAGHPKVFMSEEAGIKEPMFFCSDMWYSHQRCHPRTWASYQRIFQTAPSDVKYIGDASPRYLRSKQAVPEILRTCRNPRFVVMLRNPVDIAASQHNQRVKEGVEDVDFETAWGLIGSRLRGRGLPRGIREGEHLDYASVAMLGQQVKRLFQETEKWRVHIIFFQDLKNNPKMAYKRLLVFLGLPDDERSDFDIRNASVTIRWKILHKTLLKLGRLRQRLGVRGLGIATAISKFNGMPGVEPLRWEFRRELQEYFRQDIDLLAELTGRDLSHWYEE